MDYILRKTSLFICILVVLVLYTAPATASDLYFVDAHSQVDHKVKDLDLIIKRMNQAGVHYTILSTRGKLKDEKFLNFASRHSDRIQRLRSA